MAAPESKDVWSDLGAAIGVVISGILAVYVPLAAPEKFHWNAIPMLVVYGFGGLLVVSVVGLVRGWRFPGTRIPVEPVEPLLAVHSVRRKRILSVLGVALIVTALVCFLQPWKHTTTTTPSRQKQLDQFNGLLHHPGGLAEANDGTIYVADHDGDQVLKLAKGSNNPKVVLSARDVHWPSGVAVDSKGNVYVADAGHLPDSDHNRVLKLPADSDSNTPIVLLDHLGGPRAVAVDPAGDSVYVADSGNNRVLKVAADSSTTCDASASPPCAITLGFTDLHNPAAVAVDNAGSVYVADDGIPRVHELFKQMAPQTELFTYPPTVLDGPRGVAVDSSFNVYITDFSSNQVLELAKDSPAPPVSAGFTSDHPSGVAVGSSGNVYVTDFGNGGGRVLMLPPLPRE